MMYKLTPPDKSYNKVVMVVRVYDNVWIPFDPANRDYQEYLEWLAEGNTPLPPDEPTSE